MAPEIEAGGSEFAANETGIQAFETFWDANQWMIVFNTETGVLHWDLVRTMSTGLPLPRMLTSRLVGCWAYD